MSERKVAIVAQLLMSWPEKYEGDFDAFVFVSAGITNTSAKDMRQIVLPRLLELMEQPTPPAP